MLHYEYRVISLSTTSLILRLLLIFVVAFFTEFNLIEWIVIIKTFTFRLQNKFRLINNKWGGMKKAQIQKYSNKKKNSCVIVTILSLLTHYYVDYKNIIYINKITLSSVQCLEPSDFSMSLRFMYQGIQNWCQLNPCLYFTLILFAFQQDNSLLLYVES